MSFSITQAQLYDRGIVDVRVVLRIELSNQLNLVSHAETFAPPNAANAVAPAVPCILDYSEAVCGFERGLADDSVSVLTVQALNVKIPIWTPFPGGPGTYGFPRSGVQFGRLSDYLSDVHVGFGGLFPGVAALYVVVPSLAGTFDNESMRHYIFRGVFFDFSIDDDGRQVTMQFTEDLRWDRACPNYEINEKNFKGAPKENHGLPLPITYGNFGLWAHAGMEPAGGVIGPFSKALPYFGACLNGAVAYEVRHQPDGTSATRKHSWHCFGATNAPGYSIRPFDASGVWQCMFIRGDGDVGIVNHSLDALGSHIDQELITSSSEFLSTGFHDHKNIGRVRLRENFRTMTVIYPVKEADSTAPAPLSGTTLLTGFSTEHQKQTAKLIDGDIFSWLRDDVASTSQRRVTWEMGTERNLGAIFTVKPFVAWRRVSGSGNLTVGLSTDYSTTNALSNSVAVTLANSPAGKIIVTTADHTGILAAETRSESWRFLQSQALTTRGMRFTATWTKATAADVFDIIATGWMIEYNPARYFIENKEWTKTEAEVEYDAENQQTRVTRTTRRGYTRILSSAVTPSRSGFYVGMGQVAESGNGFPGSVPYVGAPAAFPNIIQNPAEIIRHLIWTYGGGGLDDTGGDYPPISLTELQYQTPISGGDARDFDKAITALDALVANASGIGGEKFRIALSIGQKATVKTIVRAIEASIPGLHVFRTPQKYPNDPYNSRGTIGCVFPRVEDPPSYRRPLSLENDVENMRCKFTPPKDVVNDIRIDYGFSMATGSMMRNLWFNRDIQDNGFPVNTSFNNALSGYLLSDGGGSPPNGIYYRMIDESVGVYKRRQLRAVSPFIYRPHEALGLRNSIVEWRCCSRLRLFLTCKMQVADLLPGDVFQLDNNSDKFLGGLRFPMVHLLLLEAAATASSWNGRTFLVERVAYKPTVGGDGMSVLVQAIWNGRAFA